MNNQRWAVIGQETYQVVGATVGELNPAVYEFENRPNGVVVKKANLVTDDLFEIADETSAKVLHGMQKFWAMEHRYRKHNLLYKRGILLHGKPGSGKTATISILARKLITLGGFVVLYSGGYLTTEGLSMVRKMHAKVPIICIIEDIDEVIEYEGDSGILSLLDGQKQIDGVVWLATTNHLEQLPSTLINRPSRFDEVIEVGMPSAQARKAYLQHVAPDLNDQSVSQWALDTEGFSLAHLKELVVAVVCLDHPYEQALDRLRKMGNIPEPAPKMDAPRPPLDHLFNGGPEIPVDAVLTAAAPQATVSA